jgi:hypothetical protein
MTIDAKPDGLPLSGRFFTAHRLVAYPLIFLTVYVIASAAWVGMSANMLDPRDKPLGYDFITFWAGSWLSLNDSPAAVFDPAMIAAAERIAVPASEKIFLWHYPPTFLLVVTPLSLLPYLAAYLLWIAVTFAAYALVIRKMAPQPQTLLLLAAFPGAFLNLSHGQNGFITAALLGGALMTLERKPVLAGILIGLMSFKPHFGVLLPIALVFGRHWRAFAAAAITTIAFAAVSVLFLGIEPWIAFWNNLPLARAVLEEGLIRWSKLPSLYAALRLAGVGLTGAYIVHGLVALAVAASVAWVWWRKPPLALRGAVLATGTLLATPYLFDYDYALLAIPIALLAMDGYVRGWLDYERGVLAAAWVMPLIAVGLADAVSVQIGPVCVAALFAVAVRRSLVFSRIRPTAAGVSYAGNAA